MATFKTSDQSPSYLLQIGFHLDCLFNRSNKSTQFREHRNKKTLCFGLEQKSIQLHNHIYVITPSLEMVSEPIWSQTVKMQKL